MALERKQMEMRHPELEQLCHPELVEGIGNLHDSESPVFL